MLQKFGLCFGQTRRGASRGASVNRGSSTTVSLGHSRKPKAFGDSNFEEASKWDPLAIPLPILKTSACDPCSPSITKPCTAEDDIVSQSSTTPGSSKATCDTPRSIDYTISSFSLSSGTLSASSVLTTKCDHDDTPTSVERAVPIQNQKWNVSAITAPNERPAATLTEVGLKKIMIRVRVLSAQGLRNAGLRIVGGKSDPYCTLEIQGKKGVLAKTTVKNDTLNPEWDEEFVIVDYVPGQSLVLKVWGKDFLKRDAFLGTATVSSNLFYPGGTAGYNGGVLELRLAEAGKGIDATLRVKIFVYERPKAEEWLQRHLGPSTALNINYFGRPAEPRQGIRYYEPPNWPKEEAADMKNLRDWEVAKGELDETKKDDNLRVVSVELTATTPPRNNIRTGVF